MQLIDYLKQQKLTKYKAAKELGVQWTTLWRWTDGRHLPNDAMKAKISTWSGGAVTPNDWVLTEKTQAGGAA